MHFLALFLSSLPVLGALATPLPQPRAAAITDVDVLNFALTLEHLENAFYSQGLAKYSEIDFLLDGMSSTVRDRLVEVGQHEAEHVAFLTSALGSAATAACTYDFPYNSPSSFAQLAAALEGTGVSAYSGAAQYIQTGAYLTAAAVILSTEARHSAYIGSTVNGNEPWSGPFDTPLGPNEIFTIASQFITSCPSTNPALIATAFPTLSFPSSTSPGSTVKPTFTAPSTSPQFVAFYSGLSQTIVPISSSGEVTIPKGLMGTVYAVVTSNGTTAATANTLAGPAILDFHFQAQANGYPSNDA